jgi:hypothetical protein
MIKILVKDLNKLKSFKCPEATRNINLNLQNRNKAIKEQHYGPPNPNEPNNNFWQAKADMWNVDSFEEVKSMLCGNCAAFDMTNKMKTCIAKGIGNEDDPWATINAGTLGYCKFLKFKCAAKRTCDAWVEGGPIED